MEDVGSDFAGNVNFTSLVMSRPLTEECPTLQRMFSEVGLF